MRIVIKNPISDKTENLWFPCNREDLEQACERMGIPISSGENCLVVDSSDENLSKLLRGKACNIDELDFLTKRLDSFDSRELLTFYAAIAANKAETMAEQINLTFNTHCYSLVSDFSDMNAVGKNMYLNEQGSVSAEELQNFDGKAYFEEILARNPNPVITPYGILYTNSNQPDMAYDGKHFPLYFWKDEMAVLELRHDENSEFIYLPCTHRQTETALLRLETTSLHQCELTLISDHFSDKMLSIIIDEKPLAHNMDNLNYFATKLQEIGSNEEEYFEKLMDFIKPQSQEELKVLMESMYEFELFEGIKNATQYGVYMICDSGHFTYDANIEDYIDFKGYGQQKIAGENGTFTDKGYIAYHGCNQEMARILNKNLGMQIELQQPQELMKMLPHSQNGNLVTKTALINESGLYSLILASKLPTAKKFKRWVTTEILPSIRKYGAYITAPKLADIIENTESLELLLKQLLLETQRNKEMQQELDTVKPKVEYFDSLIATDMLTNFRTTAKELGLKPMAFTQFLLDKKYIYRDKHQKILPMQPYIHYGYFQIKDFCNNGCHGHQTLITTQGKLHFLELCIKEGRISGRLFR